MSVASKRVRLNPEELYELKWLTGGLLTLLSGWTLLFLDASYFPVVFAIIGIVGAIMLKPALPSYIPAIVWKCTTPLIILIVVVDFVLSLPDVLPPLIRLIAMLSILRAVSYRKRREDLQLVMLCLFMVVVSGVLSVSIAFALQIMLFMPVAMMVLFLVTLTDCTDRPEKIQYESWRHFRWRRFWTRLRGAFDWKLLGFIGLLFGILTLLASGIFMIMPRFRLDQAIPFFKLQSSRSLSGFSDSIHFGDVTDIMEDDSVAFRVDLNKDANRPETPYWRMVVLDEYTGEGYRMSYSAKSKNRLSSDNHFRQFSGTEPGRSPSDRWTFYYEGNISKYLPMVGLPRTLRFQNRQSLEYNPILSVTGLNEISGGVTFYQLDTITNLHNQPGKPEDLELKDAKPVAYLPKNASAATLLKYPMTTIAIPTGTVNHNLLTRIVTEVTGNRQNLDPLAFSDELMKWLHQHHSYSLRSKVPEGEGDRLLRWAVSNEPGHCELFAGAFSLIARAAGHPTRIVTGFVGGAWNGYENYFMIRNRDAHAWVELYDSSNNSWDRVDPTPGNRITDQQSSTAISGGGLFIDRTMGAYIDSLRVLWYRRIVNFDAEQQVEIATSLKAQFKEFSELVKQRLADWKEHLIKFFSAPWNKERWKELVVALTLISATLFLLRWGLYLLRWLIQRRAGDRGNVVWNAQRRRAGALAERFRDKGLHRSSETAIVYNSLITIRYGRESDWPSAKDTFRMARKSLHQNKRER